MGVHVVEVIPGPIDTPALGPSRLIPGLLEVVQGRMGTGQPKEIARMIVDAVRTRADLVFCPDQTTRALYENPMRLRAEIAAEVERLFSERGPFDEVLDTLVVGGDHPMIIQAREQREAGHAARTE